MEETYLLKLKIKHNTHLVNVCVCAGTIRRTGGSFKTLKHMKSSKIKEKSSKEIRALTKIVITKLRGSEV
ncbi:hypothetical protein HanPI659440_Chr17g0670671 [Helianthus annuus]|nr:hypothetical protein HanPI659440_Chr17g0670671 [Helianthus annuus]